MQDESEIQQRTWAINYNNGRALRHGYIFVRPISSHGKCFVFFPNLYPACWIINLLVFAIIIEKHM